MDALLAGSVVDVIATVGKVLLVVGPFVVIALVLAIGKSLVRIFVNRGE